MSLVKKQYCSHIISRMGPWITAPYQESRRSDDDLPNLRAIIDAGFHESWLFIWEWEFNLAVLALIFGCSVFPVYPRTWVATGQELDLNLWWI